MFLTLKLLSFKPLVVNVLFSPSSFNVFATARNYAAPRKAVEYKIQFSKLKDIELLKGLEEQTFTTQSCQDILCRYILRENITVPNLIGCTKAHESFYRTRNKTFKKISSVVTFGKFDAEENKIIVQNVENLVKQAKMKSFVDVLEINPSDEHQVRRMEIIGSYLSQGLQKNRLPQEVFNQARKLLICSNGLLTETETRIIDDHVNGCENFKDWSSLGRKLGRDVSTIKTYANRQIRHKEKIKRGEFTDEESKKVLDHVFAANKNALYEPVPSNVWTELANCLNRPHFNVYNHWFQTLQPLLTRYEAGVLDKNFKLLLLQYCISKDIMYVQNANWLEISKDPKFVGTTPNYLRRLYISMKNITKSPSFEGLADHEITTRVMLEYQMTKKSVTSWKKKNKLKWEKCILDYYENNKKKSL